MQKIDLELNGSMKFNQVTNFPKGGLRVGEALLMDSLYHQSMYHHFFWNMEDTCAIFREAFWWKKKKIMIAMQNIAESPWKVQLSMSKSLVLILRSKELLVKTPTLFIKNRLTFSKFWNFVCFLVGSIFRPKMPILNFFVHHSNSQLLRNHMHINHMTLKISNEG